MTKRLIDVDDDVLRDAIANLGTTTIKATVNEALRLAATDRSQRIELSLDVLANADLVDREVAWR